MFHDVVSRHLSFHLLSNLPNVPCDTTMEAIDFQHLRRVERQKARQLKAKSKQEGAVNEKEASFQTAQHDAIEYDYYYPPWDTKAAATSTSITPLDLSRHVLTTNPPSLYYIPQFVTSEYSQALMAWLQALPAAQDHPNKNNNHNNNNNKSSSSSSSSNNHSNNNPQQQAYQAALGRWTTLKYAKRRVALFDSRYNALPPPLSALVDVLQTQVWDCLSGNQNRHTINHILVNEYTAQQGIMAHTDGPAYEPCTLTLSIGSEAVLQFDPEENNSTNNKTTSATARHVWLDADSLVVFTDDLYTRYRHSIAQDVPTQWLTETCWNGTVGQCVQRAPYRYSLTFRCKLSDEP